MSLSISTATAALGAAKLAQGIARGVSQAIGFHDVLSNTSGDAESIESELQSAIAERLRAAGIEVNQPLSIRVDDQGRLKLDDNHGQAAEIEALLSGDSEIASAAKRLVASSRTTRVVTIDLTGAATAGNILDGSAGNESNLPGGPGGYPNW